MDELPLPFACALDAAGLDRQRERYRQLARSVERIERAPGALTAELAGSVDPVLVAELVAVETECCPFFEIRWDAAALRLSFAVDDGHSEALDAVAAGLGAER